MCKHATSAFPVLERRCRVLPQQPASRTTAPVIAPPFRAAPVHRLRAAPPIAATSCPVTTRSRRLPGDHSTCTPQTARRRCRSPATPPLLTNRSPRSGDAARPAVRRTDRSLLDSRRSVLCCAPREPKPTWHPRSRPLFAPRDRSHATLAAPAPPHRAAEADTLLAEPTPSTRPAEADTVLMEPRSGLAPRTEARDAHAGPVPAKPPAQVSPDRTQPARLAHATEVALTHLGALTLPKPRSLAFAVPPLESPALTVDRLRRPAVPFSVHTPTRAVRLTGPSPARSGIRRPKAAPSPEIAARRPRLEPPPSQPEQVCSALRRESVSPQLPSARPKPRSAGRRSAPTGCRESRLTPERARPETASRPKPSGATCLCSTPLQAAKLRADRSDQPSTNTFVFVCTSPDNEGCRLLVSARTQTRDRQARTSRPKTSP